MQTLELVLVQLTLVHGVCFNVLRKPFLELFMRIKQFWHDEMQQRPELSHRVLDGRTSEKKAVSAVKV